MKPLASIIIVCMAIAAPFASAQATANQSADSSVTATTAPAAVDEENAPLRKGVAAQSGEPATGSGLDVSRVCAALAVVLGLIFLLRWGARSWFGTSIMVGGTRAIQLLSRSPLGPRQSVMLLRVGKRLLVVADNGSQLSSLSEITDADEVASLVGQVKGERVETASRTFGTLFARFRRDDNTSELIQTPGPAATSTARDEEQEVSAARTELSGLLEQVRMVSSQFDKS